MSSALLGAAVLLGMVDLGLRGILVGSFAGALVSVIGTMVITARARRRSRAIGAGATSIDVPSNGAPGYQAVLLTRSCTSGWTDWVHGELWLLPGALVRRSLGLAQTMANGQGPTLDEPELVDPGHAELSPQAVLSGSSRNRYLRLDDIAGARLKIGRLNGRLDVTMYDGTKHLLLWLAVDPAYWALCELLPQRMPGRVTVG